MSTPFLDLQHASVYLASLKEALEDCPLSLVIGAVHREAMGNFCHTSRQKAAGSASSVFLPVLLSSSHYHTGLSGVSGGEGVL